MKHYQVSNVVAIAVSQSQCLLTSEIKLLQFINFSSDSYIETIILEWRRGIKKMLMLLVIVSRSVTDPNIQSYTELNKKQPTF
jgi:hypothetical protein